ncbi:PREDICTED: pentatricopeptide repeat-containing protein At4g08210 [Tarenaya hassleriana]|uniref:pentatricopeptide repeat-containing protein At4g08210 n=1 Tax=Tarenaya hassleriana TaxID=28532 RepID=UPI00053C66F3|nr:PREDICTED: pentatricopeptide repeat-containing protein At4g08210 [Tarenaya hassleriana]XP_010544473.1 PREDICTED: pentatricopeptide repeat-containing protein At4g08210 [Tarenaya hassleriana]XP_010544476.1 PREDICTED: pentatricopeptide repeat-containing protein At4g08210 [Tarenaya hassleriana]XP_010544481.1 PREDICTED: pentatricopeptide repeat-containing protein At4g08210 [Tarenaya hassleriana]
MDFKHIVAALRHCGKIRAFKRGESIHAHLIKQGLSRDVFVANNLISMHVVSASMDDAQKLFDEMSVRNIVTWTTMVSGYSCNGKPDKAIGLYTQMLKSESESPNEFMYSAVLKACGLLGDLELGRSIHERILQENLEGDVVLMNALLDMYVKNGRLSDAKNIFSKIPHPNSTSWNTIISGYCKEGLMDEAVNLFLLIPRPNVVSWNSLISGFVDKSSPRALEFLLKMHREGYELDGFALPCGLKACSYLGSLAMGKQLHCCALKSGLESSCFTMSALIDMYSNCGALSDASHLFYQYIKDNASSSNSLGVWNSMLSGLVIKEENNAALKLLLQIYRSGLSIDSYTLSNALKICINLLNLRIGLQVHGLVVTSGYELDYIVGGILVDLYATLGNIYDAQKLFYKLPKKDIIAWSGLIMGCVKTGFNSLAFSLFRDIIKLGVDVDQFIISSILKACSSLSSLGNGKQVHGLCVKLGYESEHVTATALIDMYVKCGDIDNGISLFDGLSERDVVCWTGIIIGCGQNGRAKEAIQYFYEMINSAVIPNEVTFLGVLSACRHSGLVEEAVPIFESMKSEYGLEPHVEHYYCMVDLLGQAGRFEEAEDLIKDMPFEPDKTIWSSLLAACGTYKNARLVNVIAENLLKTSPEDPSVYVMLSNVYATLGFWDELSKVREGAKRLGAKHAGMSWIATA